MQSQRRPQREMPVDEVRNSLAAGRAVAPDTRFHCLARQLLRFARCAGGVFGWLPGLAQGDTQHWRRDYARRRTPESKPV